MIVYTLRECGRICMTCGEPAIQFWYHNGLYVGSCAEHYARSVLFLPAEGEGVKRFNTTATAYISHAIEPDEYMVFLGTGEVLGPYPFMDAALEELNTWLRDDMERSRAATYEANDIYVTGSGWS